MKINQLVHSLLLFTSFTIFSQSTDSTVVKKRIYNTRPTAETVSPEIDGLLNDNAWELVEWSGDYIENRPDENTAPTFQTKFKIVYDKKFLYIGVRCFDDEPDKIEKRLSRRDGFEGDFIEFNIDSYNDKRTAFSFTITAAGVKGDEFISDNGNNWDESWNPIWYAKTNIDSEGWTAEMKIPLSQLKFGKDKNQVWGLQSTRRFFRAEERSLWQRKPADTPGWVSEFGELHGLVDIESQNQLEIQPYTVASLKTFEADANNPFTDGSDSKITGGLDAKIGVTNDLTLDLTINPDFGQVEADPSAIALDGFQIFFQEQRPFFVENKNIFNYRVSQSEAGNTFGQDNVFYSRRIGRSPQGYPNTQSGEFVDQPDNTSILGAAKFSGKTKKGWSIGVLESVTGRKHASIDNGTERREEMVEPLTNYFVGRLQKDFNNQNSYIGGIFTATNREKLPESLSFLHTDAFTGGLDFKHQWNKRDWYLGGNLIFSHIQGSQGAIENTQRSIRHLFNRVDAAYLNVDPDKTSLSGTGGNIQIGKVGNGNWKFESGATFRSPELELNDLGFQRQADDIRHYTWIGYQSLKPTSAFRRFGINYNHWSAWDFGGNHNLVQFNTNSWQNWKNNWFSNMSFNYTAKQFSNTALRGGPRLKESPQFSVNGGINSDSRKKMRFGTFHNIGKAFDNSSSRYYGEFYINYQPYNALSLRISPGYGKNNNNLQYVRNLEVNGDTKYLNASIDQRTLSMSLRINYTINPNLTVQYWGQPFISRGRYSHFKAVNNPMANKFNDRFMSYTGNQISLDNGTYSVDENNDQITDFSFNNPNFSFVQFRSNLVVRWEYLPGSEIYMVWSQDVSQNANPLDGLLDSLGDTVFGTEQPQNIFLIKATYRFVL